MTLFCITLVIFVEIIPASKILLYPVIYPSPCFKEDTAEVPRYIDLCKGKTHSPPCAESFFHLVHSSPALLTCIEYSFFRCEKYGLAFRSPSLLFCKVSQENLWPIPSPPIQKL